MQAQLSHSQLSHSPAPSTGARILMFTAFTGLCVLVALLSLQNHRLEKALSTASQRSAGGLAVGDTLPSLQLSDLDGRDASQSWLGDNPSMLFFFTTTCSACEQNMDRWRALHAQYSDRYDILAVGLDSLDATRTYVQNQDLPFEVRVSTDPYMSQSLGIIGVPETVVVRADGQVAQVQVGLLPDDWQLDQGIF